MNLTQQQQCAVRTIDSNLQLIACAGSGKTEVITRRIAYILKNKPDVKPENIVAFTFTNKAGDSLRERIDRILTEEKYEDKESYSGMYVGTIHAFCKNLLDRFTDRFKDFTVLDTVKSHLYVRRHYENCGCKGLGLRWNRNGINLFCSCVDKMVYDCDNRQLWPEKAQEAYGMYRDSLQRNKCIDFSSLIYETLCELKTNRALQEYIRSIRYLVVDEYQDVDDMQEKLIAFFAASGANICVVGDDDQTIYHFRGSNSENMIDFTKRYDNVTTIRLEENFRSTPAIVDTADKVIAKNTLRLDKNMFAHNTDGDKVVEASFETDRDEYGYFAKKIEELRKEGHAYSDIAILVRRNKTSESIAEYLKDADIPVHADSAKAFFQSKYFVMLRKTVAVLKSGDKEELAETWKNWNKRSGLLDGYKFLREIFIGKYQNRFYLSAVLDHFCTQIGFPDEDSEDYKEQLCALNGIKTIADDYDAIFGDWQRTVRVDRFFEFLDESAAEEYKYHNFDIIDSEVNGTEKEDAVQIMTMHKSKGLEFDTVFIPELERGKFPENVNGRKYWHVLEGRFKELHSQYDDTEEDERKLFYVAITRAKKRLYLTYCEGGKKHASKFVYEASESAFVQQIAPPPPKKQILGCSEATEQAPNTDVDKGASLTSDYSASNESNAEVHPYVERIRVKNNTEPVENGRFDLRERLNEHLQLAASIFDTAKADLAALKSADEETLVKLAEKYSLLH